MSGHQGAPIPRAAVLIAATTGHPLYAHIKQTCDSSRRTFVPFEELVNAEFAHCSKDELEVELRLEYPELVLVVPCSDDIMKGLDTWGVRATEPTVHDLDLKIARIASWWQEVYPYCTHVLAVNEAGRATLTQSLRSALGIKDPFSTVGRNKAPKAASEPEPQPAEGRHVHWAGCKH